MRTDSACWTTHSSTSKWAMQVTTGTNSADNAQPNMCLRVVPWAWPEAQQQQQRLYTLTRAAAASHTPHHKQHCPHHTSCSCRPAGLQATHSTQCQQSRCCYKSAMHTTKQQRARQCVVHNKDSPCSLSICEQFRPEIQRSNCFS